MKKWLYDFGSIFIGCFLVPGNVSQFKRTSQADYFIIFPDKNRCFSVQNKAAPE
jgi:hypothetical protein